MMSESGQTERTVEQLAERLRLGACRRSFETEVDAKQRRIRDEIDAANVIEQQAAELSRLRQSEAALREENARLRDALTPFAKMADAIVRINDDLIVTNSMLERTADLPNYYLATRDLRAAKSAFASQSA